MFHKLQKFGWIITERIRKKIPPELTNLPLQSLTKIFSEQTTFVTA